MDAILTLLTVVAVFGCLIFTSLGADMILVGALVFLLVSGVLSTAQALEGFSNPGLFTIAALYVVAAGLKETGAVQWFSRSLLGKPRSLWTAELRMLLPTSVLGFFMNNTAVVAIFLPAVQDWAQRLRIPASKLLIPLSYGSMLSGVCTLIGTSTNLVVDGLLQSQLNIRLGLFDPAWVGVPVLLVGGAFLIFCAPYLLPSNGGLQERLEDAREYGVEMEVEEKGPLTGKSIANAGLRSLQYGYLAQIERDDDTLLSAVDPEQVLQPGDVLYFIGAPECANELRRIQGLRPASGNVHKMTTAHHQRCLVEVVLGSNFPQVGQSIREARFRSRYNAVVLSVAREGRRTPGKLGNITLKAGDSLLLEANHRFVEQHRYGRDFLLVSALNDSTPPDFSKTPLALGILALLVLLGGTGIIPLLQGSFLAAGAMIVTGCLTAARARASVDLPVLLVIAASFALGNAIAVSGLAQAAVNTLIQSGLNSPWLALALLYILTVICTELLSNNAAAVLNFPIALALAERLNVNPLPFAIAVMFAASMSFIIPMGYQTNLMVYGPGQYRLVDYVRTGLPLSILVGVVAVSLIPKVWSF
jgi:di/tricarboxylate transporter